MENRLALFLSAFFLLGIFLVSPAQSQSQPQQAVEVGSGTGPVMLFVDDNPGSAAQEGRTHYSDTLRARWGAEDKVNGIKAYQWSIESQGTVVTNGTTQSDGIIIGDLDLEQGKDYVFRVSAQNNAGQWSSTMISNGVLVDLTSYGPGDCNDSEKNGDETDIDCGGRCSKKCDEGEDCGDGKDCKSDLCSKGLCLTGTDDAGQIVIEIPDPEPATEVEPEDEEPEEEKTNEGADPDPEDGNRLFTIFVWLLALAVILGVSAFILREKLPPPMQEFMGKNIAEPLSKIMKKRSAPAMRQNLNRPAPRLPLHRMPPVHAPGTASQQHGIQQFRKNILHSRGVKRTVDALMEDYGKISGEQVFRKLKRHTQKVFKRQKKPDPDNQPKQAPDNLPKRDPDNQPKQAPDNRPKRDQDNRS